MIRRAILLAAALAGLGLAVPALAGDITRGEKHYQRHCARCHGANGMATWPGAPSFARREGLMQPDAQLLATLKKGRGAHPGFQGALTDADILDVIAFSRTLAR